MSSPLDLPPYQVYSRVAQQSTRNLGAELVGTAFVYWLTGVWRTGAVVLFGLFVLLTALDGLQVLGLLSTNALAARYALEQGIPVAEGAWLRRASYVRAVSFLIALGLLWFLYQRVW